MLWLNILSIYIRNHSAPCIKMNFKWWIRMYFFIGMYILRWYIWFSGPQGDPQNSPRTQMYVFPCMCPRMDNRSHKNLCVLEWESHATALPFRSYQRDLLQPQLNPRQKQNCTSKLHANWGDQMQIWSGPYKNSCSFHGSGLFGLFWLRQIWKFDHILAKLSFTGHKVSFSLFQVKIVVNLQHTIFDLISYV